MLQDRLQNYTHVQVYLFHIVKSNLLIIEAGMPIKIFEIQQYSALIRLEGFGPDKRVRQNQD